MTTRRELLKQAFKKDPVYDAVDNMVKSAALEDSIRTALERNPKIQKVLRGLDSAGRATMMNEMINSVVGTPNTGPALRDAVRGPALQALQQSGVMPSEGNVGFVQRTGSALGRAMGTAAPMVVAAGGLYGLSKLFNMIGDKSKQNSFGKQKEEAFKQLLKDPALKNVPKEKLRNVFDLYAEANPLVVKHPILASSIFAELGNAGTVAASPPIVRQLADIEMAMSRAVSERDKLKRVGLPAIALEPTKMRSLIGSNYEPIWG